LDARKFVATKKQIVDPGKWGQGGNRGMPKTAFPLSKTRSFQLGKCWSWRVDRIAAGGIQGRILTAFEPSKEKFLAWLAIERQEGTAIVARYEFHGDEPGWHCHSLCAPIDGIPVALVKPYGTMRIPAARHRHRRLTFGMTEMSALALSFRVFRVTGKSEGGLV